MDRPQVGNRVRFEASTLLVGLRMEADGRDPFADGWLDSARYTLVAGLR